MTTVIWALALFLAQPARAEGCGPNEKPVVQGDLFADFKVVCEATKPLPAENGWAASPTQIKNAHCRRGGPFTPEEMESFLAAHFKTGEPGESRTIHGVAFKDENPALLRLFEELTTFRQHYGPPGESPQKIFSSSCTQVRCAIDELLGKEVGLRTTFILARFGANTSPFTRHNADSFTAENLDDVAMGLSDFPPRIHPRGKSFPITRFARGYTQAGPFTLANASIFLFDVWEAHPREERQSTILHEVAHRLAGEIRLDESPEWLASAGWVEKQVPGESASSTSLESPEKAVSVYGMKNASEDFAESVVSYRYNPQGLLARSPEKYALIKDFVFDGLEYTSPDACDPKKARSLQVAAKARERLNDPAEVARAVDQAFANCGKDLLGMLAVDGPVRALSNDAQSCFELEVAKSARAKGIDEVIVEKRLRLAYQNQSVTTDELGPRRITEALSKVPLRRLKAQLRPALVALKRSAENDRTLGRDPDCAKWVAYLSQNMDATAFATESDRHVLHNARDTVSAFFGRVCEAAGKDPRKLDVAFDTAFPETK